MTDAEAPESWRSSIETKLDANTDATITIGRKLDMHMTNYATFTKQVEPAIVAIESMQSGVRTLGKIGSFTASFARWSRRAVVWLTPFLTIIGGVWAFIHDLPQNAWSSLMSHFK